MERRIYKKMEFSKKLVIVLTGYNMFLTIWAFILISVGREVPAEIVVALVTGLFGEYGAYIVRAHFGKKNEENIKLMKELNSLEDE